MLRDQQLTASSLGVAVAKISTSNQDALMKEFLDAHAAELQALVRDAPLGFGYLSLPGLRFRYANAALAGMNDLQPVELLGKTPKQFLGAAFTERHYSIVRRSLKEGTSIRELEAEVNVKSRPGERAHLVINYYPVRSQEGRAVGLWITAQDVTERKRIEVELPAERARLQTLMDTVAAGIVLSDAQGRLIYANPEAERIWGRKLIQNGFEAFSQYGLLSPDGVPIAPSQTAMAQVLTGSYDRVTRECLIQRPDGRRVDTFCSASPIRDETGRITGGLVVFSDISPVKALEQRQKSITDIAQAVNAGRSLTDVLRMVRDAVVQIAGFDRAGIWLYDEEEGGMRGAWGTDRCGDAVEESCEFFSLDQMADHPLQKLLRGEISYFLTPEYERAGFPLHGVDMEGVRSHATLALRARNRLIGMLFVDSLLSGREIRESDLVALIPFCEQAALAIDSAKLREAERDKAERLANSVRETNHRVKNNLQVVAALLDMQLMENGRTVERGDLQRLVGQIRAIASVHDFLTHSQLDLHVDVKQVLEKLLPMIAASQSLRYRIDCHSDVMPVKQGTALALAMNELVSNATKHGAATVEVTYTSEKDLGRLRVSDDGPGFPPGFSIATDGKLGLDLVRTLVRWDLFGTISAENEERGGASVKIEFQKAAFCNSDVGA